jgi:deazaflavin-dependent oxidoreductase (nitroreductase family)
MKMDYRKLPKFVWRLLRFPQLLYSLGLGPLVGRVFLLLTTRGRKTGRRRTIPLQYEVIDGVYYVAPARGPAADWYQNILANPEVEVRLKARHIRGCAQAIQDPSRIADFLEVRLKNHPRMIGAILRSEGLPASPSRSDLITFAEGMALVAIRPLGAS